MKRALKKRILPLLCVGLLLCPSHTIAYATTGGAESTMTQTEESEPSAETAPPVETPPVTEAPPPEKRPAAENPGQPSYGIEITWGTLEFDCAPLWNTDKHCYEGWESTENPITVSNTTPGGAPVQVTLTFIPPIGKTGPTVVFAPCEGDPHPEDFTVSTGQVTFLLPRTGAGTPQATINLSLSGGDTTGLSTLQYSQIGSIKTEITPIPLSPNPAVSPVTRPAENPTGPAGPPQPAPPEPEPLPAQPEQLPPPIAQEPPPETEPEITPETTAPPEQNSNEETQTTPHTQSAALPQEEPQ